MSDTTSTAELELEHDLDGEPELVVRTFRAEIASDGDGRTIEGLVIPYDVPQTVSDPPAFEPYQETVARGAFRSVTNAPNRVLLDFEHYGALLNDALGSMGSIAGTLGHAVELAERPDGLYGRFRILRGSDGDKALELAHEGVLGAFSAAMKPLRSTRLRNGVVQRLKVHLDRVSLVRVGAYPEARVMAIRSGKILEADDYEQPLDPQLATMLARFVNIPARYEQLVEQPEPDPGEPEPDPDPEGGD